MLAFIVSLLCIAAAGAAAGILFVLFGPVQARRAPGAPLLGAPPPLPFAAAPIAPPHRTVLDPARAVFTPSQAMPVVTPPPAMPAVMPSPRPMPPMPPARAAHASSPPPLPRTRVARGTDTQYRAMSSAPSGPVAGAQREHDMHTEREMPLVDANDSAFIVDGH